MRPVDKMKMVKVTGGAFQMGSTEAEIEDAIALCQQHYPICNRWYYKRESPAHMVSLDEFWIDQTEITNAQYRLCVDAGICGQPSKCQKGEPTFGDPDMDKHPVVCVDWNDAQAYCQWVDARLPTEAEWEYAFRGTAGWLYPWGDEFDGTRLNYCDANCGQSHADEVFDDGYPKTAPVGSFPSGTSWSGALNLGGNVSEWVADWFSAYTTRIAQNPSGPPAGNEKMIKGCNWFHHPAYCRGAGRPSVVPGTRFDFLGFRCVLSGQQPTEGETTMRTDPISVPLEEPATIDGTISPGEWDQAAVESFADGSQVLLMQNGGFLYVGIRANESGMIAGNVHIQRGDEIWVLHSSAALGTAIYQKTEKDWQKVQDFTWRCRNTGNSPSAQAERAEFLLEEGWLAGNGRMGTPNELEYQIKIPDQEYRLAAVYIKATPPYEKVPWPSDLEDACVQPTPGGFPDSMAFSPDQWRELLHPGSD
jgi:formylglycine-generating enzyme required for sulfatase activity